MIVVGIISTLSGLLLPSFLNWVRAEKVNSYTRELREFLRVVRLEARRWGTNCMVNVNSISHNGIKEGKDQYGYQVSCQNNSSNISSLIPPINNSIFQVVNKNFLITPNGRISSNQSIVVVIGSQYYFSGSKKLNCLIIKSPTGHAIQGKFLPNDWITKKMKVSEIDSKDILKSNKCKTL
ncbi:prepilin-type cleavage/methylation domain-containing protein [Prochlorococcus sp. AH-716-F10]|nr:prepilin-type cleavage/methylation domain-containing protein [Prochlorococcus sp. AH-716-F10]